MPARPDPKGRTRKPPPPKPAKPKGPPPKPATTNAFAPPPTGLAPPVFPTTKGRTPAQQRQAEWDAMVTEHNAAITNDRQDKKTKQIIRQRVAATAGLPSARSPFGASGAGASDPYVVDLTARSEIAKANRTRMESGGLGLTPAQAKREQAAIKVVTSNPDQRTFAERNPLRDQLTADGSFLGYDTPREEPKRTLQAVHPHVERTGSVAPDVRRAQPAYGARGGAPNNPFVAPVSGRIDWGDVAGLGQDQSWGTAVRNVAAGADKAFATGLRDSVAAATGIGGDSVIASLGNAIHGRAPKKEKNGGWITGAELSSKIGSAGLDHLPDSIPSADVDPAALAAGTTGPVNPRNMGAAGFTPEATTRYMKMALERGWYKGEIEHLNGLDLLERAYNDPPGMLQRIGQNFAGGVAQTGSAGTAFYGMGHEAATGHWRRAGSQLAEVAGSYVGALAHPGEAIVSNPYAYLPLPGAALKTIGMAGLVRKASEMGARNVRVGVGDVGRSATGDLLRTAEGETYQVRNMGREIGPQQPGYTGVINRGVYSRNLATAAAQHLSDRAAETFGKHRVLSKHVDTLVRRATNKNGAAHQMAQLAYKKELRKTGKKRAEILLAHQHAGGDSEGIARLYEAQALKHEKGDLSPAAGAAKYYREKVIPGTRELSDSDHDFLAAHELLSGHTSDTLVGLGRFSMTAKLYRQHEPLILAASERAMEKLDAGALHADLPEVEARALHILYLRNELHEVIPKDAPSGVRMDVRRGKIKEAERTGKSIDRDYQAQVKILHEHPRPVRPEKGAGPERNAAYRTELAAWKKDWATKHATATKKAAAYRKSGGAAEARASKLTETERLHQRSVPDQTDIRAQYDAAIKDFADQHLADGGMAPSRVAYTKPDSFPSARRAATGARNFAAKPSGRQQPSTGESFLSGNYLIDSKSPILENLRAQRLENSIGAYHQVMDNLAVRVQKGEAIPEGSVLIKASNAASLGRVEHELESNPVSHGAHYASEHGVRQDFTDALTNATQRGTHAAEDGFLVPKAAWERMIEYTTPESSGAYQKFLRQYQRMLISTFPGTVVGNTFGTAPLAFASGAGYRSFKDAYRAMKDPSLAPASLRGRGVAGGLASDAHNVATQYMDFMRRQSVKGEDLGRLAGYFSKAGKHIRKEADRLGMEADDYARAFAKGEIDPGKLDEFLEHAEKFLGDTLKPNTAAGRKLGNVILFHNWVGHMAKLMLFTLPVKHPGTAVVVNILGEYGDDYRRKHGVWPSWMTDYVPTGEVEKYVPGGMQTFTRAFNIGQLMPQSTAGGLLQNIAQDRPIQERLSAIVGPPLSQVAAFMQQWTINEYGTESNHANLWKTAINQALGIIPGERKAFPMQGRKPDDLSIFGDPSYKMYTSRFPGMPLSPFLQPGAVPDRGIKGFAERAVGFGGYSVPNAGPITDTQNAKQITRHVKETYAAPGAAIRKKRREAIYKAMRERGVQDPEALLDKP